ncbi:DUF3043 domain-containing protein [Granulicoccus sp. GXG6511]|uniref:DUF3043 domain-containing protein n=1 Tax=Granulicoccus sp. GXG6511 TaxID=3381351 RepID=UPI003D7DC4B7
MALFRAKKDPEPTPAPEPDPTPAQRGPRKKDGPTPTRRQAEAARMQRLNPQLSKKEARRRNAEENRKRREAYMEARDGTPERKLMRDMVDARWSLGEFLLPAMMLFLALSFLQQSWGGATFMSLGLMYGYILLVLLDLFLLWRKYKRVAAQRFPGLDLKGKGVMMFGFNRSIQIRRMRMPRPVVERGGTF